MSEKINKDKGCFRVAHASKSVQTMASRDILTQRKIKTCKKKQVRLQEQLRKESKVSLVAVKVRNLTLQQKVLSNETHCR